jgi:hypothetical protein
MGYESYSFLLNGSAMMFIALIALSMTVFMFGGGKIAAG